MHACDGCQDRLLDLLYGLLDQAEAQELRDHLDGCAQCAAAFGKAQAAQGLLAAASRLTFPSVVFAAPADPEPVLLPIRPRLPRRASRWRPWAAAAAVLLAVAGLG
ncbi:MAG: hypothetical protein K2W96_12895, partial [Gemmataceae bacterium]|nr:hypothetical protein [Gemmataceae bacterium]